MQSVVLLFVVEFILEAKSAIAGSHHQPEWNERKENDVRRYSSENSSVGKSTMGEDQG
jgi:hypothetical protein